MCPELGWPGAVAVIAAFLFLGWFVYLLSK